MDESLLPANIKSSTLRVEKGGESHGEKWGGVGDLRQRSQKTSWRVMVVIGGIVLFPLGNT
jgi:hypothetical protein